MCFGVGSAFLDSALLCFDRRILLSPRNVAGLSEERLGFAA